MFNSSLHVSHFRLGLIVNVTMYFDRLYSGLKTLPRLICCNALDVIAASLQTVNNNNERPGVASDGEGRHSGVKGAVRPAQN